MFIFAYADWQNCLVYTHFQGTKKTYFIERLRDMIYEVVNGEWDDLGRNSREKK